MNVPKFGKAPVGLSNGYGYFVDTIDGFKHAGSAEQLCSIVQKLKGNARLPCNILLQHYML